MANFLVVGSEEEKQLLAFDFSRAFFWRWPWNAFGASGDTTRQIWTDLRERHGFDLRAAQAILDRLELVDAMHLQRMMEKMPSHWLSTQLVTELLAYCSEGGWAARVQSLREGLENGAIV
jgi:hypothetical protein